MNLSANIKENMRSDVLVHPFEQVRLQTVPILPLVHQSIWKKNEMSQALSIVCD